MTIMKIVLRATICVAAFQGSLAYGQNDWSIKPYDETKHLIEQYNLPPDFTSDQLKVAVIAQNNATYEKKYNLKPGFHGAELCAAQGQEVVNFWRNEYNLPPGFTDIDFDRLAGAQRVNGLIASLNLPSNFTEEQLAHAWGSAHPQSIATFDTGWSEDHVPFSGIEYAKAAGLHQANELARKKNLPHNWTYADLKDAVGPEEAASLRKRYGFSKTDSHEEVVRAIGLDRATQFAKPVHLLADFTADQLVRAEGQSVIDGFKVQYSDNKGEVNEDWIASHEANYNHVNLRSRFPNLPAHYLEADLLAAAGAEKCSQIQERFDLDPDFTESDISKAEAESYVAGIRTSYQLQSYFTAADVTNAQKSINLASRYPYSFR